MKNPAEDQPVTPPTDGATPKPSSLPQDDGVLWLVSFADDDDRELRPPDIAASLRQGEIDANTIVWRDGMEDWVPLGGVPSLARLLPASGETANAPLVIPNPRTTASAPASTETPMTTGSMSRALVPRTKGNEPSKPSAKAAPTAALPKKTDGPESPSQGPALAPTAASAAAPAVGAGATAGTSAKRDSKPPPAAAAAKTAEPWRGKTRLGLPQPPEIKRIPSPAAQVEASAAAKKSDVAAIARTPNAPKTAIARTPNAPKVSGADAPSSTKGGATNIWDDEDDGPVSVDPESIRPLSPTPSLVNATALSRGTLGNLPRKPPPPAPRPAAGKPAPPPRGPGGAATADAPPAAGSGRAAHEAEKRSHSETPAIGDFAGPVRTAVRVDDDILNLGGGAGMSAALLSPPAMDLAAFGEDPVFSAEGPPIDSIDVPVAEDETATVPKATAVAPRAASAATGATAKSAAAVPAAAATATAKAKKRSILPFVLGGAVALYLVSLGLRKPAPEEPPPAPTPAAEQEPARVAEPPAAAEPAPAAPAAEPAPEPSAAPPVAAAEPPLSPPTTTGPTAPTTRVAGAKTEAPAGTKPEAHAAATKPEGTPASPAAKTPEGEKKPAPAAAPAEPEPKQVDMGGDFDKAAASAALGTAAGQASGCRKDGDPTGVAVVHVTFANSGRATRATIEGPPFAGTATGGCIAAALRGAKVPPFGGDRVTVTKRVVIQ